MYTHDEVERWLQEEIKKAKSINIPIHPDIDSVIEFPKAQSFYGMCHKKDEKHPNHHYRIRISEYFLNADEDEIRQTIMHELIHTCPECMNHGHKWKHWAGIVNNEYGYDIARIGDYHDFNLRKEAEKQRGKAANRSRSVKYKIICPDCGKSWLRTRRSRATENIENYCCPKCRNFGRLKVEVM